MVVRLNGKSYMIDHLLDVSESIKPGESNLLEVQTHNRSGPGGLAGHVRLLRRAKAD